ncbi:MAG: hypothetical protein WBD86_02150 [Microgenomates group bacterium]
MGAFIGYTAIKHNKKATLDAIDRYYKTLNLGLVEEGIAGRQGKYIKYPDQTKSLEEFYQAESRAREKLASKGKVISTNFVLFSNLKENKGWQIMLLNPRFGMFPDPELAEYVSRELNTAVINYYYYSVPNTITIDKFINGNRKDAFHFDGIDFEVEFTMGEFGKHKGIAFDSMDEVSNIKVEYLKSQGLNFEAAELNELNPETCYPMYLSGNPDDIKNYLYSF